MSGTQHIATPTNPSTRSSHAAHVAKNDIALGISEGRQLMIVSGECAMRTANLMELPDVDGAERRKLGMIACLAIPP
jgi:hypothetical protein